MAERPSKGLPLPMPDGDVTIFHDLDLGDSSAQLMDRLTNEIPWCQQSITLFGRSHMQPRLICWMGDDGCSYRYSGKIWHPVPWHPLVANLRHRIEHRVKQEFNAVLINLYRDGQDSMGLHADDEPELGEQPTIASLSLGGGRTMHFRHRHAPTIATQRIMLTHGSLLLMQGETQAHWKHGIPKTRREAAPRINLTFRRIYKAGRSL